MIKFFLICFLVLVFYKLKINKRLSLSVRQWRHIQGCGNKAARMPDFGTRWWWVVKVFLPLKWSPVQFNRLESFYGRDNQERKSAHTGNTSAAIQFLTCSSLTPFYSQFIYWNYFKRETRAVLARHCMRFTYGYMISKYFIFFIQIWIL
jgi:hypothetical protein